MFKVKAPSCSPEGRGFKLQCHPAAPVGALSKALNPVCSRGAVSWLTPRSDLNYLIDWDLRGK